MRSGVFSKSLTIILATLLGSPFSVRVAVGQAPTGLNISVVPLGAGVAAISKSERQFSVQVQDVSTGPIVGAQVVFSVPDAADGSFADGSKRATVFTDLRGTAVAPAFRFMKAVPIPVQVQASFRNQTATTTLSCCDAELPSANNSRRKAILAIVIGAAAGVGIYYATRSSAPSSSVIRAGTPTVETPPH